MKVCFILLCALALLELSHGKPTITNAELNFDEGEDFLLGSHVGNDPTTMESWRNLYDQFLMAQILKPFEPNKVDAQQERAGLNTDNFKVFTPNSANKPKFSIWG